MHGMSMGVGMGVGMGVVEMSVDKQSMSVLKMGALQMQAGGDDCDKVVRDGVVGKVCEGGSFNERAGVHENGRAVIDDDGDGRVEFIESIVCA